MISRLKQELASALSEVSHQQIQDEEYAHMKYPRLVPLMDFYVDRYRIEDFGHLMVMHTKTRMGMELLTMSFMPDGFTLPYLLIDAMTMKKKRCVFVEYYGCDHDDLTEEKMKEVYEKHKDLPDYEEKPNWYIKERRPYSLIKTGEEQELIDMTKDSIHAYLSSIKDAKQDPAYKEKLKAFRDRMIKEGNPSSKTLEMLLKEEGAIRFMREAVMPFSE
ncbi:MAG: hypothetical protein IKS51_08990 [Erysipelotrichaceae bacterium]|nr:hypothetical protein [Erysipelotrichaceae bacterium]